MKHLLMILGLLFEVSICLATPVALLILPFENATGQTNLNSLQKGIPDLLAVSLTDHSDRIQIVERQRLEVIMTEQSLKWENVMTQKALQLGQLTQARYILRGSLIMDPKGLRIQANLYETETVRMLKSFAVSGSVKQIESLCDKLARDMANFFISAGDGFPQSDILPDPDLEINSWMAEGLSFYHQNQFAKAIPEFMKVLEKQPRYADAKYWLTKSYAGAGLKDDAILEAKDFLKLFPNDPRIYEFQEITA